MRFDNELYLETWDDGKLSVTLAGSHVVCFMEPVDGLERGLGELFAASPKLLESLDNVTAALETLLIRHGAGMSEGDLTQRTRLAEEARALVEKLDPTPCDTCDGSGIRACGPGDSIPEGFEIIERCDACDLFEDDVAAAAAWGTEAQWFDGESGTYAIARPKGGAA